VSPFSSVRPSHFGPVSVVIAAAWAAAGGCSSDGSRHRDAAVTPMGVVPSRDAGARPIGPPGRDEPEPEPYEDAGGADVTRPDGAAGQEPAEPVGDRSAEPDDDASYVFDQNEFRTYDILIEPAELEKIEMDPASEMYVNGRLEFEGKTYGPLGVRYKGSVGAFLPPCTASSSFFPGPRGPRTGKCSFKIDFDRVDPEARFYGMKKLNLHSMNIDPSLMRDRLGYALFREFGIAAPRAVHTRVLVNGELRGVYIAVEQIDGRFTKSRFTEGGDGNVYKEVWPTNASPEPYQNALETNRDQNPSVQKMVDFATALTNGEDVSEWLDVDYMLRYIAVDRVIVNDDGPMHLYCGYSHNFYWYEGQNVQRFWLIPWDLDASFQLGEQATTHITPAWNTPATICSCGLPACDPVWGRFATRIEEYERSVDEFLAGPYSEENVSAKLTAWSSQIDAAMQEASGLDGSQTYEAWKQSLADFLGHVETTREHRGYPY